jgi:TPR repeat protein
MHADDRHKLDRQTGDRQRCARHRRAARLASGAVLCALVLAVGRAGAADIGGFFADQQKAQALAADKGGEKGGEPGCPQRIASAAADGSALAAYRAGLCYLQAEQPDMLAAKAWLSRGAELGFMPAHRLLRSLLIAEAAPHGSAPHCHPLGEGRQLCHGGAPPLAVAQPR